MFADAYLRESERSGSLFCRGETMGVQDKSILFTKYEIKCWKNRGIRGITRRKTYERNE